MNSKPQGQKGLSPQVWIWPCQSYYQVNAKPQGKKVEKYFSIRFVFMPYVRSIKLKLTSVDIENFQSNLSKSNFWYQALNIRNPNIQGVIYKLLLDKLLWKFSISTDVNFDDLNQINKKDIMKCHKFKRMVTNGYKLYRIELIFDWKQISLSIKKLLPVSEISIWKF